MDYELLLTIIMIINYYYGAWIGGGWLVRGGGWLVRVGISGRPVAILWPAWALLGAP